MDFFVDFIHATAAAGTTYLHLKHIRYGATSPYIHSDLTGNMFPVLNETFFNNLPEVDTL